MKSNGQAKGALKSIKIDHTIDDDESLASTIDDYALTKLVTERESQEEIEADIDDL